MLTEQPDMIEKDEGTNVSGVGLTAFKEGRALQVTHVGPHSQMHETYAKLHEHGGFLNLFWHWVFF